MKLSEVIVFLSLYIHGVSAQNNPPNEKLCYILDAILALYGIVLTIMYCRLRMHSAKSKVAKDKADDSLYQGLTPRVQDTYETIQVKKIKA